MNTDKQAQLEQRKLFAIVLNVFVFLILGYRFFSVQIIGQEEYKLKSDENRIRPVSIQPIRGLMFDREGKLIVDSVPAYSISAIPYEMKTRENFMSFIGRHFGEDSVSVADKLKKSRTQYQAVKIMQVDYDKLTVFEENIADLPGILTQVEPQREYPSSARLSHFLGYIKEIDEDEINQNAPGLYQRGDIIGKKGLELQYENFLRGKKGNKYYEVNALGQVEREIITENTTPAELGNSLVLTIDLDLQTLAEELLGDRQGAVIAMNPQNGEIYVALSKPDYPPALMSGKMTQEQANSVYQNPGHPLYNRATQSVYPPGSTFKIIGAIAALNDSIVSPEKEYSCAGSIRVGRKPKFCWNHGGHGTLDMWGAIEQSCNVYFYNLSRELEINRWAYYAGLFELGQKTGVDIPEENGGILPDSDFLDRKIGKGQWHHYGTIVNLIIGQGELLTTPLQMARFVSTIGTKGKLVQPHFLKHVINTYNDSIVYVPEYTTKQITQIHDGTWDVVREGMRRVVNGERGTARSVRMRDVVVSGKTGTSQNAGEDHAWFIGYADFENPTIAIAVLVENGGGGSRAAAPIAGALFRKYYEKKEAEQEIIAISEGRQ